MKWKKLLRSFHLRSCDLLHMVWAILTWPKFSLSSYRMISRLSFQGISPRTVIDVGSNVGQFAVAALEIYEGATLYSFEPNPDCQVSLRKNLSKYCQAKIYPVALGDHLGKTNFYVNSHSHSSSVLPLTNNHKHAFPDAIEIERIEVEISTLDQMLLDSEMERPVLLKLDVQGYESLVLAGASHTLKKVDYVILETSFKPMYEGEMLFLDLLDLMSSYDFTFLRPVTWLSDNTSGEIIQMDVLFKRN